MLHLSFTARSGKTPRLVPSLLATLLLTTVGFAQPLPTERPVEEIRLFHKGGGRLDWSAQGDWIAFDKRTGADRYQIHVLRRDGTSEKCLTCEIFDLRKTNAFNPVWHPSGDYIVFQVQTVAKRLGLDSVELATAHRGLYSDLWILSHDGRDLWQLTRVREQGGALLDPRFSHEGDLLMWSERVRSRVGRWGRWALRVAELKGRRSVPRLAKPRTYEPGTQKLYLAGSSFTPDDRGALLAGNREPGQAENGMDVYRLRFDDGSLTRLTHTRLAWDEGARFSPKGDRIVWSSANEIGTKALKAQEVLPFEQLRDLWIMNADGSEKERLTFFNHSSSPESVTAAIVDDFAWSPEGDQILAHVVFASRGDVGEAIYLIRLEPSFRR